MGDRIGFVDIDLNAPLGIFSFRALLEHKKLADPVPTLTLTSNCSN